jgi:hypothetical protein
MGWTLLSVALEDPLRGARRMITLNDKSLEVEIPRGVRDGGDVYCVFGRSRIPLPRRRGRSRDAGAMAESRTPRVIVELVDRLEHKTKRSDRHGP